MTTPAGPATFDALVAEVMADPATERFGHREHVHVTWLAVRRHGVPAATGLVGDGLRHTARYAGAPRKYHSTVSRSWVELIGYHAAERADPTFADLVAREPLLLDKRLLIRFYHRATLASPAARGGWLPPDREPFPWLR